MVLRHRFAWAAVLSRRSISVRTVTADSALAASPAATKPGSVSAAVPTAGARTVPKDGSTIVTGRCS
jgi:hypothetical protein